MRVVLVGTDRNRAHLRKQLEQAGIDIVRESEDQPASLPSDVDAIVVAGSQDPASIPAHSFQEELTPRERDVLALVAEGLPNKAIASALGISDQTVKFHVAAIIGKLGASNRTDAVRRAVRRGLVAI